MFWLLSVLVVILWGRDLVALLTSRIGFLMCCNLTYRFCWNPKSVMSFENNNYFKKWVSELRPFLNRFRSVCSSVTVNTGHKPFPVSYGLIFKTYFWTLHLFALFVNLLTSRIEDRSRIISNDVLVKLFSLGFIWFEFDFVLIFFIIDIDFGRK